MNYGAIYTAFISQCLASPHPMAEHKHHILPRCMGGDDHTSNLVRLTHRQHIFAHLLLYKVHRSHAMRGAVLLLVATHTSQALRVKARHICKLEDRPKVSAARPIQPPKAKVERLAGDEINIVYRGSRLKLSQFASLCEMTSVQVSRYKIKGCKNEGYKAKLLKGMAKAQVIVDANNYAHYMHDKCVNWARRPSATLPWQSVERAMPQGARRANARHAFLNSDVIHKRKDVIKARMDRLNPKPKPRRKPKRRKQSQI